MNNPINAIDPLGLEDCWNINCLESGGFTGPWAGSPSIGGTDIGGIGDNWASGGGNHGANTDNCGVDPFCIAHGGTGPFASPVAQSDCHHGCMAGSWMFAQYNAGGTYTVNWDAQRQSETDWAINAFLKQEAAVAARLGIPVEILREPYLNDDGSLKDPNNTNKLNPFLQGGNWNFQTDKDLGCAFDRCGSIPSLHFHPKTGFVHLDTANPLWGYGLGAMIHFGADVFLGNTVLASGIPR